MVFARIGLLRTLPPPNPSDVQRLHRTAQALGIDWPAEMSYPDFIRSLDPEQPSHAAMVMSCTRLLRGSGYVRVRRGAARPVRAHRAGLAVRPRDRPAAPPRRPLRERDLRCLCARRGARLGARPSREVPDTMQNADQLAHQYENAVIDLVEAGVLRKRVGEKFEGVVVDRDEKDDRRGTVTIQDPAIEARVRAAKLPLGTEVTVTLAEADLGSRSVAFSLELLRTRLIDRSIVQVDSRRWPAATPRRGSALGAGLGDRSGRPGPASRYPPCATPQQPGQAAVLVAHPTVLEPVQRARRGRSGVEDGVRRVPPLARPVGRANGSPPLVHPSGHAASVPANRTDVRRTAPFTRAR